MNTNLLTYWATMALAALGIIYCVTNSREREVQRIEQLERRVVELETVLSAGLDAAQKFQAGQIVFNAQAISNSYGVSSNINALVTCMDHTATILDGLIKKERF